MVLGEFPGASMHLAVGLLKHHVDIGPAVNEERGDIEAGYLDSDDEGIVVGLVHLSSLLFVEGNATPTRLVALGWSAVGETKDFASRLL